MKKKIFLTLLFLLNSIISFAQSSCYETVILPSDPKLGGGDKQGSVLIGNTYGSGQGPGIYVVADGAYRLYMNGELLAYDNAAGRSRFIPMTFLPGTNAISVIGVNGTAAPGVMIHIDELHQSYGTNGNWKSKTSNYIFDANWKNKSFDTSQWGGATEQSSGSLTNTPSGLAISGANFPANSNARWIWSGSTSDVSAVFRFSFDIKAFGYGAATNGGENATTVVVDNMNDFLAENLKPGPRIILLKEGTYDFREYKNTNTCYVPCNSTLNTYKGDFVDLANNCPGTVRTVQSWSRLVWVGKDKSYIGMGRGASLRGVSFYCNNGQSNMIFRNLKVWDVNPHIIEAGDGISVNGAPNVWVDHCTFKWISDGNDVSGSNGQTWSWNYVNGDNEFMCSKSDNYAAAIDNSKLTYDHVYWENCQGRDPDAAGGDSIHMINNYHNVNKYYAVGGLNSSEILVEGTVFNTVSQPLISGSNAKIYQRNNQFINSGSFRRDNVAVDDFKDNIFTPPYIMPIEDLSTVAASVKNGAGAGGRWRALPLYTDTALQSNKAPSVSITSPIDTTLFSNVNSITINANASDTDGTVAKVEFYSGTTKLGEDTSAPYSYTISNPAACTSYSIVAIAIDNSGNTTMSIPVMFSVNSTYTIYKTNTTPVIDGNIDSLWSNANVYSPALTKNLTGLISNDADLLGTCKALWDNNYLYLLANIADDTKINDSSNFYDDDSVEFYVDINNDKSTSYGPNDVQYSFGWNDGSNIGTLPYGRSINGINYAITSNANGYILEARIPWTTMQATPQVGQRLGFDFMTNDDDDNGARDGKLSWSASTDFAWNNPSLFGTAVLQGVISTSRIGKNPQNNQEVLVYSTNETDSNSNSLSEFKVFPNPTTGIINIDTLQNTTVQVYDFTGKKVLEKQITVTNNQIDISNQIAGIYLLKLSAEDGQYKTVKVVKQ
nr:sugar-binding protein [uncultured Flavobacterium sp.]